MTEEAALELMKAPGDKKPRIWRDGVIQVKWTTACNLTCVNCTAKVPQIKDLKRVWWMSPDQLREALRSLRGFGGVIGAFGGNPCLHPKFEEMCAVFREEIPNIDQRGLWSNNLMGKAAICRQTFAPHHSNLNVHMVEKAALEIEKEWPEALAARREMIITGATKPSLHGSWDVALKDVIPDEGKRWELISKCPVNQGWSAEITLVKGDLRVFFCEYAATRGEFFDVLEEEDVSFPVTPGWWHQPMEFFRKQVCHHCHRCSAPLNPHKIVDLGNEPADYSDTNAKLYQGSKRPSRRVDKLEDVTTGEGTSIGYLGRVVLANKE
jgi:hypothetical protein